MYRHIAVIGSNGAIGGALLARLQQCYPEATIDTFARHAVARCEGQVNYHPMDYHDESSIAACADGITEPLDLVLVTVGILHDGERMPEKAMHEMSADNFHALFNANTIVPALVAKRFIPKLVKGQRSVFAALSARVGSISDNRLGGWYAYRASKAALNMVIKNLSIETARRHKQAIIVGLHPGTVDSELSKPFQRNVPEGKLFTPDYCAEQLLAVMNGLHVSDTGKCFAWDGQEVIP